MEAKNDPNRGLWPEPFLEVLAQAVAVEAEKRGGVLAVGPTVVNL